MEKQRIKIGVAATRRDVFSKEAAREHKNILLDYLKKFDAIFIDIEDINEEGLLFDDCHVEKVVCKFRDERVDGVFFPHTNFGSEFLVAQVSKQLGVPTLIWGPRDDTPAENGSRSRDTQCGLFATGKVLRRFGVPFTYIPNCALDADQFANGLNRFIAVCGVVGAFKRMKILEISNRPATFWTMIINEGELLEKFGIQVFPITLVDLVREVKRIAIEKGSDFDEFIGRLKNINCDVLFFATACCVVLLV